jgi:hypothetical protein
VHMTHEYKKPPAEWYLESDGAAVAKALLYIRDKEGWVPIVSIRALDSAKAVLGINLVRATPGPSGLRRWHMAADWPVRCREAGIDPETRELVDPEKWSVFCKGVQQRKALKKLGRRREETVTTLKAALKKYKPEPVGGAGELLAQHAATSGLARYLRRVGEEDPAAAGRRVERVKKEKEITPEETTLRQWSGVRECVDRSGPYSNPID